MTRPGDRPGRRTTPATHAVFRRAFEQALRLGHQHLGCEHLLLALAEADHPAAASLRSHGLAPERVREQLADRAGSAVFGDLDASALTAIGIDLEVVRERALASFGPAALMRVGASVTAPDAARPAGHPRRWTAAMPRWAPRAIAPTPTGRVEPGHFPAPLP